MPTAEPAALPSASAGRQILESVLPRKRHGAFGEGPTEKDWATSTSPAAYSTFLGHDRVLCACLMAWGTNTGLGRMAEISDISYHDLQEASDDFMRLETLGSANDLVVDGTAALPSTQHYNLGGVCLLG